VLFNRKHNDAIQMSWTLLVENVDGARVEAVWGPKPDAEELRYAIGGMYDEGQEQQIIDELLNTGYSSVEDSACTTYELNNI
jgi:hypothetical protein